MPEALVVIAIVLLIASFVVFSILDTRKKNRDTRREQDIKQIQNALNIYVTNKSLYPICDGNERLSSTEPAIAFLPLFSVASR